MLQARSSQPNISFQPNITVRSNPQKGSALLLAIIILFLAGSLSITLAYRSAYITGRTYSVLQSDLVPLYGSAAESLAQAQLVLDFFDNEMDTPEEDWTQPVPLPFGEGSLEGQIYDLQGCFNLNNLVKQKNNDTGNTASNTINNANNNTDNNTDDNQANEADQKHAIYVAQFKQLLAIVLAEQVNASYQQDEIANAIIDWVDSDSNETIPGGAEDASYYRGDTAYRTANRMFSSLSELRLIQGITPEIYATLTTVDDANRRPLCVLPKIDTAINVNFAQPAVLASLRSEFTLQDGENLVNSGPYLSHNEFLEHELFDPPPSDTNSSVQDNTENNTATNNENNQEPQRKVPLVPTRVNSSHFLARGTVNVGDRTITLFTLLQRDGQGQVKAISRSRGVF